VDQRSCVGRGRGRPPERNRQAVWLAARRPGGGGPGRARAGAGGAGRSPAWLVVAGRPVTPRGCMVRPRLGGRAARPKQCPKQASRQPAGGAPTADKASQNVRSNMCQYMDDASAASTKGRRSAGRVVACLGRRRVLMKFDFMVHHQSSQRKVETLSSPWTTWIEARPPGPRRLRSRSHSSPKT
jgi:hypothetical protein